MVVGIVCSTNTHSRSVFQMHLFPKGTDEPLSPRLRFGPHPVPGAEAKSRRKGRTPLLLSPSEGSPFSSVNIHPLIPWESLHDYLADRSCTNATTKAAALRLRLKRRRDKSHCKNSWHSRHSRAARRRRLPRTSASCNNADGRFPGNAAIASPCIPLANFQNIDLAFSLVHHGPRYREPFLNRLEYDHENCRI